MIKLVNLSKYYHDDNNVVLGLSNINLELNIGEFVAITGESGSGKSTLLNVISGLDSYEDGEMYIDGNETSYYTKEDWELYRRDKIGFIFQNYNLIDSYTVVENVISSMLVKGIKYKGAYKKAIETLSKVGLSNFINKRTSELSGGQKQRLAIARALAKDTDIIVADEPTGNLDSKNGKEIIKLLSEISKEKLVCIVTHNYEEVEEYVTRKIRIFDGKIVEDRVIKPYNKCDIIKENKSQEKVKIDLFRFAFLNLKNQPKRTIFLFLVTFIMTLFSFALFILIGLNYNIDGNKNKNHYFENNYEQRVIVTRKDKKTLDDNDIEIIRNVKNVNSVFKYNDMIELSNSVSVTDIENMNLYYTFNTLSCLNEKKLICGHIPENDNEVCVYVDYIDDKTAEKILGNEIILESLSNYDRDLTIKYTISGVTREKYGSNYSVIYLSDEQINKLYQNAFFLNDNLKNLILTRFHGDTISLYDVYKKGSEHTKLYCDKTLEDNEIRISSGMIKNIKQEFRLNLEYIRYIDDELKIIEYEDDKDVIYLSDYYYKLIFEESNKISINIDSSKKYNEVKKELNQLGYYTTSPYLTSYNSGILSQVIMIIFIFFICGASFLLIYVVGYLVIKTIMYSKRKDYSILRTIGIDMNSVLKISRIEITFNFILAYIFTTIIFYILRATVTNAILREILLRTNGLIIVMIGIFNIILGLFASKRFAKLLVKKSIVSNMKVE